MKKDPTKQEVVVVDRLGEEDEDEEEEASIEQP